MSSPDGKPAVAAVAAVAPGNEDMVFELNPDYKITTTPKVVKTGSVLVIMAVVLLVLLLLILFMGLLVWMTTSVTVVTVLDPVQGLCQGKWENGTCVCKNGQSGANCNLQARGFYLYTGTVTTALPGMSQHENPDLQSCQNHCNETEGCTGVQWEREKCTLLTSALLAANETVYAPVSQGGLYVKELHDAIFTDRAILAARRVDIPHAYSQVISSKGYAQVFLNTIVTLNFVPRHVSMPPGVTGIFSRTPFTTLPSPSDDVLYFQDSVFLPSNWTSPVTVFFTVLP